MFRKTTMRRAMIEALAIFSIGRLLAMVPLDFWPPLIFPAILISRLALSFCPPVWAAMRVVSTKREKMSRRFWRLGWQLAIWCAAADALVALLIGEAALLGGPAGPPDLVRFGLSGTAGMTPTEFVFSEMLTFAVLSVYFTIAVVCTRLANGGFLRFTMPAGKGRVTL